MAEEPGPHGRVRERPDGPGDRRAEKLHGASGHGQERRNSHSADGGGIGDGVKGRLASPSLFADRSKIL
jgi:hypothetical protein